MKKHGMRNALYAEVQDFIRWETPYASNAEAAGMLNMHTKRLNFPMIKAFTKLWDFKEEISFSTSPEIAVLLPDYFEAGYSPEARLYGMDEHAILLNPFCSFSDRVLNEVLWHELTHARQAERWGRKNFKKKMTEQVKAAGLDINTKLHDLAGNSSDVYYSIPAEQEAIAAETIYAPYINLVRGN